MEHTEDFIKSLQIPLEVLDDLASRFILNMPIEEKYDPIRILFQMEIAFWHYLDFCRVFNSNLPKFKFKRFAQVMFNYVPRLRQYLDRFDEIINEWIQYKQSIPCSGAIMIDKALEHLLLVQGFGNNNWGFPKGKVNHDESLSNCAIREVSEETGYNCIVDESQFLERKVFDSPLRLYFIKDVDFNFNFIPQARNEIRSIKWFPLKEFARICKSNRSNTNNVMIQNSSKFASVIPFIPSILKWVKNEKRKLKISRRQELKSQNECNNAEKQITILMNAKQARDNILAELEGEEELNLSSLESNSHNVSKDHSTSFVDVDLKSIFGFGDSNIFNDTDNHKDNVKESDIVTFESKWNSINADYNQMINEKKTNNINDIFTLTTPFNNYLVTPPTSKLPHAGTLEDIERALIHSSNNNSETSTNKVSNVNTLLDANVSCDEKLNALFGLAQNNFPTQNGVDGTLMISNKNLSFSGDNNHRDFTKNDSSISPRKTKPLDPIGTKRFSISNDQLTKKNIDKNNSIVKHSGQTVISKNHNEKMTSVEQLMIKSSLNFNMEPRNNQTISLANGNHVTTPSTTATLNSLFNLSKQSPILIPNCSVMNNENYFKQDNSNGFNGLENETIINVHPKIELLLQRLRVINN